jgi:hypothetical protein
MLCKGHSVSQSSALRLLFRERLRAVQRLLKVDSLAMHTNDNAHDIRDCLARRNLAFTPHVS